PPPTLPPPPTPAISSLSPSVGRTTGGTSVVITGQSFDGATAVSFGGVPASSFTVTSSTSITATAPAGSGTVDVQVTTPGGTSALTTTDWFRFVVPQLVYQTRYGDLNGDGRADVCGRGSAGVICQISDGSTFGSWTLWSDVFADGHGWGSPQYGSTIMLG